MRRYQRGFTLVEIMIVVAIIALLAIIAIPNLLRARMTANEALAQSTLRTLSTAAETYASSHNGNYPTALADLTEANPPYLNRAYVGEGTISGFEYTWPTATDAAYEFVATLVTKPEGADDVIFSITTGGILERVAAAEPEPEPAP